MSREYTSAAKRAAAPAWGTVDAEQMLAWVDGDPARARQVLRDLDAIPTDAAGHEARRPLVEALLAVFPSFTLDAVEFRVEGEMQLLDLCELMKLARRKVKTSDPSSIAALAEFFEGAMGAGEYERFRSHCREHCTDPDVLNDIMEGVVEDLTDRPTSRPSPSAAGPLTSGPTSKVVSLSPTGSVQVALPEPAGPLAPDMLSMTPEQFADWQAEQRARAQSPLGVPIPPVQAQTPESVYFG